MESLIKQRLTALGLDADEWCRKLQEFGAIMAGSFPLQCILKETWAGSDIDIFFHQEPVNEEPVNDILDYHPFEKWLYAKYDYKSVSDGCYPLSKIRRARKTVLELNDHVIVINTITVKNPCVRTFIHENFDISLCMIEFDGREVSIPYQELTLAKIGFINNDKGLGKLTPRQPRIGRPNLRIKLENKERLLVYQDDAQFCLMSRMVKYAERGCLFIDKSMINEFQQPFQRLILKTILLSAQEIWITRVKICLEKVIEMEERYSTFRKTATDQIDWHSRAMAEQWKKSKILIEALQSLSD